MNASHTLFFAVVAMSALSTASAGATCQWASNDYAPHNDPSNLDQLFTGVDVLAPVDGTILMDAPIDLDFWGGYWTDPGPGPSEQATIATAVRTMLQDPSFWSRYGQYSIHPRTPSGHMGQVLNHHTDWRGNAGSTYTVSDSTIQNSLSTEGLFSPVVVLAPYLHRQGDGFAAGYHLSYTAPSGSDFPYAEVEYGSWSSGTHVWSASPQSGDVGALSQLISHEIMEMVTDPFPTRPFHGWVATQPSQVTGMEIGDFCNGLDRIVNGVRWQQTWLQEQCRCDGSGVTFANQWLTLTDPATGTTKCLDIADFSGANGTPAVIWDCTSGAPDQLWSTADDGTIHNGMFPDKCLDLRGSDPANNTTIDIYDCAAGTSNLVWSVTSSDAMNHPGTIVGFGNRCIALSNEDMTDNTGMVYYDCFNRQWNESWSVIAPQ